MILRICFLVFPGPGRDAERMPGENEGEAAVRRSSPFYAIGNPCCREL